MRPCSVSNFTSTSQGLWLAGLMGVLSAASAAGASVRTLPDKTPDLLTNAGIPRRLVVIDNVCAWPNLVQLKDSTLAAIVFNQPSHGNAEGDVDCWTSKDGLSWKHASTVTRHEPKTVRMNHGAGTNAAGELVVLCNGWDRVEPTGRDLAKSLPIHSVMAISKDGGRNWDRPTGPALPKPEKLSWQVPFGDMFIAANGDLVAGTYSFTTRDTTLEYEAGSLQQRGSVYAARSRDGGRTWTHFAPVVEDRHVEAAMLHVGNGKWIAASRRFKYKDLDLFASDDDAFTWKHTGTLDINPVSAAHLLKLSDGRILLTYGNRHSPDRSIEARVSRDGGKTWGTPFRLGAVAGDLGYPDAVEMPGGRILVAYYASAGPQHQRYHMGVFNVALEEIP